MNDQLPHIIIIGGGFAGLATARALKRSRARITLIDRSNHHLFQPLLYQVATAALSPADIAAPIRKIVRHQRNCEVLLAEVTAIDPDARTVTTADGESIAYDAIVVASGATHSYFGKEHWAQHAPGLKTIDDALLMRQKMLLAYERAEHADSEEARRRELTFVVVGGGPTGVELAGSLKEIASKSIQKDFRHIDTSTARIILVEANERVLTAFPESLSARALRDLKKMGVQVRLNSRVTDIDADGVMIGDERVSAANVLWAAGVKASALGAMFNAPVDRAGRVIVEPDLSVPEHPEAFVLGDLAAVQDSGGEQVAGVAPAAVQMGRFAGRLLARRIASNTLQTTQHRTFRYRDKGMLATIGRARAVAQIGRFRIAGLLAWLLWAGVHVMFLVSFRSRVLVMLQWGWEYIAFSKGARLITGTAGLGSKRPKPDR